MSLYFRSTAGQQPCPLDPYYIVPDKCKCVDYQVMVQSNTRKYFSPSHLNHEIWINEMRSVLISGISHSTWINNKYIELAEY